MCGIVGVIGHENAAEALLDSLFRLEYRGYDSAGIATLNDNKIHCLREKGKIRALAAKLAQNPLEGDVGIAHTRWATHGKPSVANAHPIVSGSVAVVHNGIIENFSELKSFLQNQNVVFNSDTDTEVVAALINFHLQQGSSPKEAFEKMLSQVKGAFALAILFAGHPDLMIVAKYASPLAIGYGDGKNYVGSDAYALASFTNKICYLEDGDYAIITRDAVKIYSTIFQNKSDECFKDGNEGVYKLVHDRDRTRQKHEGSFINGNWYEIVERPVKIINIDAAAIGKGEYKHFMLKEIFEQPQVLSDTIKNYLEGEGNKINFAFNDDILADIKQIKIVACGTSYYSGYVAKYWLENIANIQCEVEIASEFRYRKQACEPKNTLAIFISQSGETLDTLAALKYAKTLGFKTLSIVNVAESSIDREANYKLYTYAGPEIGVASTKAFTCQLAVLAILTLAIGTKNHHLDQAKYLKYLSLIREIPGRVASIFHFEDKIKMMAKEIVNYKHILYIGRASSYPIALEAALKLKELSYIHADAIPAGELKHGTIALLDEDFPVIAIAPHDHSFEKIISNAQEIMARNAKVFLISSSKYNLDLDFADKLLLPDDDELLNPFIYAIPAQLIAYHVAYIKGTDIDQPRNLAKSVTVE